MNALDLAGRIAGVPLGVITFCISFLRSGRTFHLRGVTATGEVESFATSPIQLHPYVLVRFSNAMWREENLLPDVLGITLRFSKNEITDHNPREEDQDLLFASFKYPWQTPFSPFITHYLRFYKNTFYAISPFKVKKRKMHFKLTFESFTTTGNGREKNLEENIQSHATLVIWSKEKEWQRIGRVTLKKKIELDQEALKFNPFRAGLRIKPSGFIQALRFVVYPFSQSGRKLRHRIEKVLHKPHDRLIVERL